MLLKDRIIPTKAIYFASWKTLHIATHFVLSLVKLWDLCWEKFHAPKIQIHVHPQKNADSYTKSYALHVFSIH
jgi:hypothetical protein